MNNHDKFLWHLMHDGEGKPRTARDIAGYVETLSEHLKACPDCNRGYESAPVGMWTPTQVLLSVDGRPLFLEARDQDRVDGFMVPMSPGRWPRSYTNFSEN